MLLLQKNIENELFNSKNIFIFKKGYIDIPKLFIILSKNDVKLIKKCQLKKFKKITIITNYTQTNANLKRKKLYLLYQKKHY